jgi:hypothetical protein
MFVSATDLAIAAAIENNSLRVRERQGRFGLVWLIEDSHGLIETALSAEKAAKRIDAIKEAIAS